MSQTTKSTRVDSHLSYLTVFSFKTRFTNYSGMCHRLKGKGPQNRETCLVCHQFNSFAHADNFRNYYWYFRKTAVWNIFILARQRQKNNNIYMKALLSAEWWDCRLSKSCLETNEICGKLLFIFLWWIFRRTFQIRKRSSTANTNISTLENMNHSECETADELLPKKKFC